MCKNIQQNILIVDDEKSNIDIIIELFEQINQNNQYNIIATKNAQSTLKIITKRTIDLILLDVMLPNTDGFSICEQIKENPNTKNIPIVFITSKNDEDSIEQGFECGAADYITKPFKPKELLARVKNQLQLKYLKDKEIEYNKNQALNKLIQNIAHHWRQPLSHISTLAGGMQMLKEIGSLSDEKFYRNCELICDTTQNLSSTIENFANFNKNINNYDFETFNIKQQIDENYNLLFFNCDEIDVTLTIDKDINISSSSNQLFQVLISLITNAKEALHSSDQKVIYLNANANNDYVTIEVLDSGGGIQQDSLIKVFEPYYTTKHKSQGTGLGLFSVEKIVTQILNGSIKIDNIEFDHNNTILYGARVTITLPL